MIVFELEWKTNNRIPVFFRARFAQNLVPETYLATCICAWEMVCGALFFFHARITADKCCSFQAADATYVFAKLFKGKEKIVKLAAHHLLLSSLLNLTGPEGAVDVDKLVNLEGNQSASYPLFARLLAKNASQLLLWILYCEVLFLTHQLLLDLFLLWILANHRSFLR